MPFAPLKMRSSRTVVLGAAASIASLVGLAGCAMTPTLNFSPDDAGISTSTDGATRDGQDAAAPLDATIPAHDAGADGPNILPENDSGSIVIDNDDAGIDANTKIACGSGFVNNCQNCAGATLRCTINGVDACVSDCTACGEAIYPCLHCNAKGVSHGNCVTPNANGRIACSDANRCDCTAGDPSACPRVAGASQTCLADLVDAGAVDGGPDAGTDAGPPAAHCFTCGEPKTGQATCDRSDGTSGICKLASGAPVCK